MNPPMMTESIVLSKVNAGLNRTIIRFGLILALFLLLIDWGYKTIAGISVQNRQECVLYNALPRIAFLFYEYFIELFLVVIAGTFAAVWLNKRFKKMKRFFPRNQFMAFLYASVIPVCSCSAIPLIETMKERLKFRTIITFVVAAPLLNPYIISLSFTVLGYKYALLRIAGSFIVSMLTGLVAEYFYLRVGNLQMGKYESCSSGNDCSVKSHDVYQTTWMILKKIFPYLVLAGMLGMVFEFYNPSKVLQHHYFGDGWLGVVVAIFVGVPIYLCNGADILFLYPILNFAHLSMGAAIAFSITSTAVCASSIVMLSKFLGPRLTALIIITLIVTTLFLGLAINFFC